jgi:hypothetical protein
VFGSVASFGAPDGALTRFFTPDSMNNFTMI